MQDYIKTLEKKFDIKIECRSKNINADDYFDVDNLGNIVELYLSDIDMGSLEVLLPLADHLVELTLKSCNIKSLASLKSFSNLEVLNLRDNKLDILTLKNLNFLPKLKKLDVSRCDLEDTSYLGDLIQLEYLNIGSSNSLYEIKGLERLNKLQLLDVERSSIESIRNIHVNENLRSLNLSDTGVTKISDLDRFPNLEELKIRANYRMEKMEGLSVLRNLKQLLIRGTSIKQIEGLEQLTNLEVLDLSDNEILEINGLSQLTKLRKLNLNENDIRKVENLDGLINLELLMIEANKIQTFNPNFLEHLVSECHIYMRGFKQADEIAAIAPQHVKINFRKDFPYPYILI